MDSPPPISWEVNPNQNWSELRVRFAAVEDAIIDMIQGDFDLAFIENTRLYNEALTDEAIRSMYGKREDRQVPVNWKKEGF